jgi:hypothetical protein
LPCGVRSIQALLSAPNPDDPLADNVAQHWKTNEAEAMETGEKGCGPSGACAFSQSPSHSAALTPCTMCLLALFCVVALCSQAVDAPVCNAVMRGRCLFSRGRVGLAVGSTSSTHRRSGLDCTVQGPRVSAVCVHCAAAHGVFCSGCLVLLCHGGMFSESGQGAVQCKGCGLLCKGVFHASL